MVSSRTRREPRGATQRILFCTENLVPCRPAAFAVRRNFHESFCALRLGVQRVSAGHCSNHFLPDSVPETKPEGHEAGIRPDAENQHQRQGEDQSEQTSVCRRNVDRCRRFAQPEPRAEAMPQNEPGRHADGAEKPKLPDCGAVTARACFTVLGEVFSRPRADVTRRLLRTVRPPLPDALQRELQGAQHFSRHRERLFNRAGH